MDSLKKPTPLWVTIGIVVILAIAGLYLVVPSYRIEKFRREAFSTHLVFDSHEVLIEDGRGGALGTVASGWPPENPENITKFEHLGEPPFWNFTVRFKNGTYHVYYSIKMDGSNIAGTYSVILTLQNVSKVFTFTVATDEKLPRTFDFQWNTSLPPTTEITWSMSFHKGWFRTPSFGPLLYYFITFLPEYFAAVILVTTILVVLLTYRLVKRKRKLQDSPPQSVHALKPARLIILLVATCSKEL